MSGVVDVARSALQKEATQLVNMFRNTLTFTITYSVVAAIVESRVEIVPLLLPSALVVVLATLMIQQAIDERVAKNAHFQKSARMPASSKLLLATKSAVMSISSVAVQFTGNLVALGLSEVITNSRDSGWVLWFVLIAIMMVYVATDTISAAAS